MFCSPDILLRVLVLQFYEYA